MEIDISYGKTQWKEQSFGGFQDGGLEGGCISCCSRTQDSKEEILRDLGPTQSSRVSLSHWGGIPDGTVVPERRELCEVELPARRPSPRWSSELRQLGASERRPLSTVLGLGATTGALAAAQRRSCAESCLDSERPLLNTGGLPGGGGGVRQVAWTQSDCIRAPGGCSEEEASGELFGLKATTPEHQGG